MVWRYRINTAEIEIPPLRERKGDIPTLCSHFIRQINRESDIHTQGISSEVLDLLISYDWPGNVRELKHVVERLAFINPESLITIEDCGFLLSRIQNMVSSEMPSPLQTDAGATSLPIIQPSLSQSADPIGEHSFSVHSIRELKEQTEKSAILSALKEAGGNKAKASRILGIDRSLLYYKLKKYHIEL